MSPYGGTTFVVVGNIARLLIQEIDQCDGTTTTTGGVRTITSATTAGGSFRVCRYGPFPTWATVPTDNSLQVEVWRTPKNLRPWSHLMPPQRLIVPRVGVYHQRRPWRVPEPVCAASRARHKRRMAVQSLRR